MTATRLGWWGSIVPRVYTAKPLAPRTVSAMRYDGTPQGQAAIRRWLAETGPSCRPAHVRLDHGQPSTPAGQTLGEQSLVIEQSGADTVQLAPGEFLVRRHGGWHTCPRHEFEAGYDLSPREVPIYDDGQ